MTQRQSLFQRRRTPAAMRRGTAPAMEPLEPRSLLAALPLVTLSVADPNATELNTHPGKFAITRTGSVNAPLTVGFTIAGSATPGTDYIALRGTATIPAGRSTLTIPVLPIDDLLVEGPENVRLILTADPAHYRLDTTLARNRNQSITIQDDDDLPVITLATPDASASEIGKETATIAIRRTGPTDLPLTVNFVIAGSATPGADYAALPTSVTIQNGKHAAFLTVRPFDDAVFEGNETVRVVLLAPGDGRYLLKTDEPASERAAVVIQDRPLVTLLVADPLATSDPSDTAQFVLFRTGPTTDALKVHLRLGGTGANGTDYARLAQTITIPAGSTFTRVLIRGLSAPISPSPKTVTITLTSSAMYNLDTSAQGRVTGTVMIIDDTTET